jgi:hypothetical protein
VSEKKEPDMNARKDPPKIPTRMAAEEALRRQLHNLEETIGRLIRLKDSLPQGTVRNRILAEISALDSIADVQRQALDSLK